MCAVCVNNCENIVTIQTAKRYCRRKQVSMLLIDSMKKSFYMQYFIALMTLTVIFSTWKCTIICLLYDFELENSNNFQHWNSVLLSIFLDYLILREKIQIGFCIYNTNALLFAIFLNLVICAGKFKLSGNELLLALFLLMILRAKIQISFYVQILCFGQYFSN